MKARRTAARPRRLVFLTVSVRSTDGNQQVLRLGRISVMGKTMADVLIEQGERKGERKGRNEAAIETRQQMLIRLLRRRFQDIPGEIVNAVQATREIDRLDQWLDRLVTADSLHELEISDAN